MPLQGNNKYNYVGVAIGRPVNHLKIGLIYKER